MVAIHRFAVAAAFLTISGSHAAATDASSCYVVSDGDARNYCLAKARKNPGMCYAVSRPDLRTACLAEVRR